MKALVAIMAGLALSGCMTVGTGGRTTGHYLGYVRVVQPVAVDAGFRLEDVTALGGWIETDPAGGGLSGGGVGFRRAERAMVSPEACGLTIVVSSAAQLAAVERLIRSYAEGQACTVRRTRDE